jgi:hypothetical protein
MGGAIVNADGDEPARVASAKAYFAQAIAVARSLNSERDLRKAVLVGAKLMMRDGNKPLAKAMAEWVLSWDGISRNEAARWRRSILATPAGDNSAGVVPLRSDTSATELLLRIERQIASAPRNA